MNAFCCSNIRSLLVFRNCFFIIPQVFLAKLIELLFAIFFINSFACSSWSLNFYSFSSIFIFLVKCCSASDILSFYNCVIFIKLFLFSIFFFITKFLSFIFFSLIYWLIFYKITLFWFHLLNELVLLKLMNWKLLSYWLNKLELKD